MIDQPRSTHEVRVGLSTSSMYPEGAEASFEVASSLGYDGMEIMVWSDRNTQNASTLRTLMDRYSIPILAIHAPTLLLTRSVFGASPWGKIDRSIELAQAVGASTVVIHPPFFWQTRYARQFVSGIAEREQRTEVRLAVENMFTWRTRTAHSTRDFQAYSPTWDPIGQGYRSVTLDVSHAATSGCDSLAMARSLGPTLRHVHMTDGVAGPKDDHLLPGQGSQHPERLLQFLASTGFDGDVVIEVGTRSLSKDKRREALADCLAFCRKHLGHDAPQ
ncbi:sugar phosphate isomerase/epimerase family protein [Actinomyces vulturis]|uniref:sugar phosphate isomerase/epimerase family protein n=1 Tax=Actinomyces vulturis TaxID=1857645 RepID=UPI0008298BD0|nr:sugar phosphate isomerase/epimerase family protein [Actinomyces vulturis]